jgi:hypothetical protein
MSSLFRQVLIYIDCYSTASTSNIEAEKNVRRSIDATSTTDLEHGTGVHDHREPEEHRKLFSSYIRVLADPIDGNGRRYAGGQQGDEEAVQRN